jgi:hypothetical protein
MVVMRMRANNESSRIGMLVAFRRNECDPWETQVVRWDPRMPAPLLPHAVDIKVIGETEVPWPLPADHLCDAGIVDPANHSEPWYDRRQHIERPADDSQIPPSGDPVDGHDFKLDLGEPEFGWLPMFWTGGGQTLAFEASNVYAPQPVIARWLRYLCRGGHPMMQIDIEDVFVEFGTAPWPDGRMRLWGVVQGFPQNGAIDLIVDRISAIRRIHQSLSTLELRFDQRDVLRHWCEVDIFEDEAVDDPCVLELRDLVVRRFPDPEVAHFLVGRPTE